MCLRPLWAPERHAPVIKDGTGRKGRRWLQALPPLPWQLRQFVQPSAEVHQSLAATWGSPQGLTGKPLLHDKDKPSANLGHPHHPFPKKTSLQGWPGTLGAQPTVGFPSCCHLPCAAPARCTPGPAPGAPGNRGRGPSRQSLWQPLGPTSPSCAPRPQLHFLTPVLSPLPSGWALPEGRGPSPSPGDQPRLQGSGGRCDHSTHPGLTGVQLLICQAHAHVAPPTLRDKWER